MEKVKDKEVLFARVGPEAKAWAMEKAAKAEVSAGDVVESLLLQDKKKILQLRESRKAKKAA